ANTMKSVGVIAFDGVNALDLVGPLEVFANAGRADFTRAQSRGVYALHVIGLDRAPVFAESGIRFVPDSQLSDAPALDTVIVPGGSGLREPSTNSAVSTWLRLRAPAIRRVASVCTGVYALAPTGLLDGRRVTTHWRFAADVARCFPRLNVDANSIFLKDGRYYTSGGITAGIDLALALVEEDLGPHVALTVAAYGRTPADYVESLRLNVPREHLVGARRSIEAIAASVGFANADVFSRRFRRRFGISPRSYRERFPSPRKARRGSFGVAEALP